ncbi:MAG: hypothetical protein LH618_16345 [Saprospiraceae bacterium]|nr:hypothetical protein [Saprospiraceae bacterium]
MQQIHYRPARSTDAEKIALLHVRSWQENYRGIWQDQFLDNDVIADWLKVWQEKLHNPLYWQKNNQRICAVGQSSGSRFQTLLMGVRRKYGRQKIL